MRRVLSLLLSTALAATVVVTGSTAASAAASSLFISEYVEGTSNNKAVEIYNGTGDSVDLADWDLERYANGDTTPGVIDLVGTVADGDVHVVANGSASFAGTADQTSGTISHNGNDGYVLRNPSGSVVDSFGQSGVDPGAEWDGGGENDTLRRKSDVCAGDPDFTDSFDASTEYDTFPVDTFAGLGTHNANCGETGPSVPLDGLLLNEVVVMPTGGEFVEIVNTSAETIDLSDVYLFDATFAGGGAYYYNLVDDGNDGGGDFGDFHARFPDGATIGAGELQTVALAGGTDYATAYGEAPDYELVAEDTAVPDMREATSGSIGGQGGLSNDGEVAILYTWDGQSDLVQDLDYVVWGDKAEAVDKTDVAKDGPDAGTETSTYLADTPIVDQEVVGNTHADGLSFSRLDTTEGTETQTGGNGIDGDDETSEDLATTWAVVEATPGAANVAPQDGLVVCDVAEDELTLISAVQGSVPGEDPDTDAVESASPLVGEDVVVEAVVTAVLDSLEVEGTIFVQEEADDTDDDVTTSEGVAVPIDDNDLTDVAVGDLVRVGGTVEEDFTNTRIGGATIEECTPTATPVDVMPTQIPFEVLDLPRTFDLDTRESLEGMLVTTGAASLTVTDLFPPYAFGEIGVSADGLLQQPTERFDPTTEQDAALDLLADNAENFLTIDDAFRGGNRSATPWLDEGVTPRGGDTMATATGTLYYSFDQYKLEYRDGDEPAIIEVVERPESPELDADARIATFNVLNLFNGDGRGGGFPTSRGAETFGDYLDQRDGIVDAILGLDAAVVGLVELENDYGDGERSSIAQLVDALNAAAPTGSRDWAYVDPGTDEVGTDAIAVGVLYRETQATPIGTPATFDIDANLNDEKNRWPLAQTFTVDDVTTTLVVNHLKSKGSSCADTATTFEDPQPDYAFAVGDDTGSQLTGNCDLTRVYAANQLLEWLETDPTGVDTDDHVIGGDLNAYSEEAPIDVLEDAGWVDLVETLDDDKHSYSFDGRYGRLDHLFASPSHAEDFDDADVWQINSSEPYGFQYDGLDAEGVYASSDHDPVLASLALPSDPTDPTDPGEPGDTAEVDGDGSYTLTVDGVTITITFDGVSGTGTVTLAVLDDADSPRGITIGDVIVELTADGFTFESATFTLPTDGLDDADGCFRLRGDEADDVTGDDDGEGVTCEVDEFSVFAAASYDVTRLAGGDRIATAVEISMADHPDGASLAYVARADLFADAVAGGPVAFADDAPILLTRTDELPTATADELERLGVDEIVVLGGEDAVDQSVVDALAEIATTSRIAGGTRYETATMAAADTFSDADVVYVATGENFPDALTGGVAAALADAPVLLVQKSAVPEAVATEIERLSPSRIVLLGGPDAIDQSVEDALDDLADTVDRIAGGTRYDTARMVADTFDAPVPVTYVATGEAFPDALAGVPSAAAAGGPILLTTPDVLSETAADGLAELDPDRVVVLGGPDAVADDTVAGVRATLIGAR